MCISYHDLDEVAAVGYFDDGSPSEISIASENLIVSEYGMFIPQYCPWEDGRRYESVIRLHRNGKLKSFTMQHRAKVKTSIGTIECDAISFYDDGSLNRIFPLNGKLSGYWSEAMEYALAEDILVNNGNYSFSAKIISAAFYPSGNLKSVTLWPEERIILDTPAGKCQIRTGLSFYEDGRIKSFEPAVPVKVSTPIGIISAFNPDPDGICGDVNSLEFTPAGKVKKVSTVSEKVVVVGGEEFLPGERRNLCFDTITDPVPLRIAFDDVHLFLGSQELFVYKLDDFSFELLPYRHQRNIEAVKYACNH